ncbi:MAG: hypothetical protein P4L26_03930 [Terracidiphilus sp.]|jgi:hypothetical protein|nr:hypothetical protein [Terracidiphilus sp.]
MNLPARASQSHPPALTNGSGAAAILSAGIGVFVLAVLAVAADQLAPVNAALVFYKPTGVLSGVTTAAILVWLITWVAIDLQWRKKTVAMSLMSSVAFTLLILSFLLTFPPIADLF